MAFMLPKRGNVTWFLATIALVAIFASWDYAATCLFLGVVVPLHVLAIDRMLRVCPPSFSSTALSMARLSLLIPAVVAIAG